MWLPGAEGHGPLLCIRSLQLAARRPNGEPSEQGLVPNSEPPGGKVAVTAFSGFASHTTGGDLGPAGCSVANEPGTPDFSLLLPPSPPHSLRVPWGWEGAAGHKCVRGSQPRRAGCVTRTLVLLLSLSRGCRHSSCTD